MLSNISWSQYLIFISVAALSWYVVVIYTYYRHDLLHSLQIKKDAILSNERLNSDPGAKQTSVAGKNPEAAPDISQIIQSFTDEVQAYFQQAGKEKPLKADLLIGTRRIAHKYPTLGPSEFKESLNQFIITQAETYCAMSLNEEDLDTVWAGT